MATLLKTITDSETILMVSPDATFPVANGVIVIGTEIITYNNNYMGTLYGCVRGAQSSSAAAHTAGDTVSLRDYYHAEAGEDASFSNLTVTGLTASRAVVSNGSKVLASSVTTLAELAFVSGVTSAIQTQLNLLAPKASPTFTGVPVIPTPFTLGAVSVTTTGTEINYIVGVTSAIQTQLNTKAPTASPTFTGTVVVPTPFTIGAVSVTATGTELNYVVGVTSAIQTQLNALPVVSVLSADPGSPTEGRVWYNTTTHLLKFYNGTDVKTVLTL